MTTRSNNTRTSREMTPADYGFEAARHEDEKSHDEENPAYLLSGVWTTLLVQIAKGEVDVEELAKKELANRGLNNNGNWVGFKMAADNTKYHYNDYYKKWMYVPDRDEE